MEKFVKDVQDLIGIRLKSNQLVALKQYEEELLDWNSRYNLTAIGDIEGIRTKHFLDSLTCLLPMRDSPPNRIIDVGTGAGFPGIPLKIVMPNVHMTLVESIGKKTNFCHHIIKTLGLEKIEVIQSRVEDLGQSPQHREKYDWAVARAVANLTTLVEYLLPLVKVGGTVLSQKGSHGPAEIHKAESATKLLGGHVRQLQPITLPGVVEERYLIIIDKIVTTPPQYPRKPGIPGKKPI